MERIGIIDIGSNSIRLVIIDVKDNGAHHLIENLKRTVRLRSGVEQGGLLTEQGIDTAVETISLFVKFCHARRVNRIIAAATAAVRGPLTEACLSITFSSRPASRLRFFLGRRGYLATQASSKRNGTTGLMVDLGGGR